MPKRVSQEEWDARAAKLHLTWLDDEVRSHIPALARCDVCGHEWRARPRSVNAGHGCPICSGHQVPDEEWKARASLRGITLLEEVAGSHNPIRCRCDVCGAEWRARPSAINRGAASCMACSGRNFNQDAWNSSFGKIGCQFLEPVKSNTTPTRAECLKCGHEWMQLPVLVATRSACPECVKQNGRDRRRIPQSIRDDEAAQAGLRWLEPVLESEAQYAVECVSCGHQYKARPGNVRKGHRCPRCAHNPPITQAEWRARAAALDLEWLEPITTANTTTPIRCLKCGFEWSMRPGKVKQEQACPNCAEPGFNPAKPAVVYLVQKEDGTTKVGISGEGKPMKQRMQKHRQVGYTRIVTQWRFAIGEEARKVERETIRCWREDDDLLPAAPEGEPGWVETVHVESLPLEEIIKRINKLAREQPSFKE